MKTLFHFNRLSIRFNIDIKDMDYSKKKISDLRKEYTKGFDAMTTMSENPYEVFKSLFDLALENDIPEPNAMTLATADKDGIPSARIVLLKGYNETGFRFYTNYESRKGQELAENPNAALVFLWLGMETQIRIRGSVEKLSDEIAQEYFDTRPIKSRIGAWASAQSKHIEDYNALTVKFEKFAKQFEGQDQFPKPDHWGGYVVMPKDIEFWFGRRSRLHYRRRYFLDVVGKWRNEVLSP